MRMQQGFTLIDLLIAVAIIGILAAIAIPSYEKQAMQSRRTDAKTALLDLASREERLFATNNTYTNDPTQLYGSNATFPLSVPGTGTNDYQISVLMPSGAVPATGTTFLLQAVPINNQALDDCGTYQLDNTGAQTNINTHNPSSSCW